MTGEDRGGYGVNGVYGGYFFGGGIEAIVDIEAIEDIDRQIDFKDKE